MEARPRTGVMLDDRRRTARLTSRDDTIAATSAHALEPEDTMKTPHKPRVPRAMQMKIISLGQNRGTLMIVREVR